MKKPSGWFATLPVSAPSAIEYTWWWWWWWWWWGVSGVHVVVVVMAVCGVVEAPPPLTW